MVVLIAIMTALILPEMRGTLDDAVLRKCGRQLIAVCNLAHSRAITRNEIHRVRLDPQRGEYTLEVKTGGKFQPLQDSREAKGAWSQRVTAQLRRPQAGDEPLENADHAAEAIAFYADGTADDAEILLRDRAGFRLLLQVNPVTARVAIYNMEGE